MQLLREYYEALGAIITRHEVTLTSFSADGLMILVNPRFHVKSRRPSRLLSGPHDRCRWL
ncbi:hypothetical protein [Mesorhizobium sp.]|uniref:hypothetical protein n=1 Tax=Mesorhizobium sp. TaxID=1871066 RepID=UPI0025E81CF2|nr:hypothetical protein [Mesorhizobium sp.]